MASNKINFEEIEWEHPTNAVRQKVIVVGNQQIRLVRFEDGFEEVGWCEKGHIGYVLDGEMKVEFEAKTIEYKKGDGLSIEVGKDSKHKAIIASGKFVELILFENL